ncbi:MAG: SMC-Scp complex subunit ScpB [Clostridiaceae bacterium]
MEQIELTTELKSDQTTELKTEPKTKQTITSDPISKLDQREESTQGGSLDKETLQGSLEAILFAAGEPVSIREMADMLEVVPDAVETILDALDNQYRSASRGIFIIRLEDKIQLATKVEYSRWVLKLAQVNERQTLSKGALECLAIVAYKQPVTRVEVDEIRGVSSDYVMAKLLDRGFISVIGRKNVPGKPKLYATSEEFLRQFGFANVKIFTQDETFQELMKSVESTTLDQDGMEILPDIEPDAIDETQISIWD